jgi:hypothetical protein
MQSVAILSSAAIVWVGIASFTACVGSSDAAVPTSPVPVSTALPSDDSGGGSLPFEDSSTPADDAADASTADAPFGDADAGGDAEDAAHKIHLAGGVPLFVGGSGTPATTRLISTVLPHT